MPTIRLLALACILGTMLMSALLSADTMAATKKGHWSYEGNTGPEHWGNMRARFKTCKEGRMQSPIDIKKTNFDKKRAAIVFEYTPATVHIVERHNNMAVEYRSGNTLKLDNRTYELLQFHLHHPSEHTIKGKPFAMEIHFVHQHSSGTLAVIAVAVAAGKENPVFGAILAGMEAVKNGQTYNTMIDTIKLLPTKKRHFSYTGSLTTPPCTEDVHWVVFKKPIRVSAKQIATFQKLRSANARPTQPIGSRPITEHRI